MVAKRSSEDCASSVSEGGTDIGMLMCKKMKGPCRAFGKSNGKVTDLGELSVVNSQLVVATCNACTKREQNIWSFSPNPIKFYAEFKKLKEAVEQVDESAINELRCATCFDCREASQTSFARSTKTAVDTTSVSTRARCKALAEELREEMGHMGCERCGERDHRALRAVEPDSCKFDDDNDRPPRALDWSRWFQRCGAAGDALDHMRLAFANSTIKCMCCIMLDEEASGNVGIGGGRADRADDSQLSDKQIKARELRDRHHRDRIAYDKKCKRAVGGCQHLDCQRHVNQGTEVAFHWTRREKGGSGRNPVSILLNANHTLIRTKPLLDEEYAKCRLLCANHKYTEHTSQVFKNVDDPRLVEWKRLRETPVPLDDLPSDRYLREACVWLDVGNHAVHKKEAEEVVEVDADSEIDE